ncbi:MAG: iron complex transport system substrate-binding protein [Halioglobus sp.]|jgi:iron complex transport system substrate-binding protein
MNRLIFIILAATLTGVSQAQITVVDALQRTIVLSQPATRIVALAPHIVENTFSAGAGDKLVGVVSYSDYPTEAKSIPLVGSYKSFSAETIVALKPDLIIAWGSGNGMNKIAILEKLGIPVFISDPHDLDDVARAIRDIGTLAGSQTISEREATRVESALSDLRDKYQTKTPHSVFYQVWNDPIQTINGEHLISKLLSLCGGYNIFDDALSLAPKVNVESILQRNPDAIVASGMGVARPDWLDVWKQYPSLSAVKNNALFFVHPDHIQRPTARIVLGAQSLCEQLHSMH